MTVVKTFSGLEFKVRRATAGDVEQLIEFWRHVSRTNLQARYVGIADPTELQASLSPAQEGRTTTFLALGGEDAIISIAMLVSDAEHKTARVMAFTHDAITFHGVSWALLQYVLGEAREKGILTVNSVFSAEDVQAIRLERDMGFIESVYPPNSRYRVLEWTLAQPKQATQAAPTISEIV